MSRAPSADKRSAITTGTSSFLLILMLLPMSAIRMAQSFSLSPSLSRNQIRSKIHRQFASVNSLDDDEALSASGYRRPVVQWYPGHIAKAERMLQETLKAVDVVVEVRNARAPKATSHPMVGTWCAGKPRLVVLTHSDQVPRYAQQAWLKAYQAFGAQQTDDTLNRQVENQARQAQRERFKHQTTDTKKVTAAKVPTTVNKVEDVLMVNAKEGAGIHALARAIYKAGSHVTARREKRGLRERSLRVGIIGYPNVGKSALINRLLGKKRARTANTPGVTRSLQWIRVRTDSKSKREFELLDSPGIIPAILVDQSDALLLAACNCIGDAAYDNQGVAAYLCEWMLALVRLDYHRLVAPEWLRNVKKRYDLDLADEMEMTGEDMLFRVADNTCRGDPEDAARKILQDFRAGRWGDVCLQVPPVSEEDGGQRVILGKDTSLREAQELERARERQERADRAVQTAKEQGLELPPVLQQQKEESSSDDDVGKGLFDGW